MADELKFIPILAENLNEVDKSNGQLIFDVVNKGIAVDVSDERYIVSNDAELLEKIDQNTEAINQHTTAINEHTTKITKNTEDIATLDETKQDNLIAGQNITINNNVISANILTDYNDLTNKPIIEQDLNNSEFTPVENTYYLHTGTTTSTFINGTEYFYSESIFRPIDGKAKPQVQADWNETDTSVASYIKNKPDSLPQITSDFIDVTITPDDWAGSVEIAPENYTENYIEMSGESYGIRWGDVAYGDGKYVVTARATNYRYYDSDYLRTSSALFSSNGKKWEQIQLPFKGYWPAICYGNGIFIASNTYSSSSTATTTGAAYSVNGKDWTYREDLGGWYKLIFGNNKFIGIKASGLQYSDNGYSWTNAIGIASEDIITGITYAYNENAVEETKKHVYIAISLRESKSAAYISYDAINWTKISSFPTLSIITDPGAWSTDTDGSICFGDNKLVVTGYNSATYFYSEDFGETWTISTLPSVQKWGNINWGNGKFLLTTAWSISTSQGGTGLSMAIYSYDGKNWLIIPQLELDSRLGIQIYGKNEFIIFSGNLRWEGFLTLPDKYAIKKIVNNLITPNSANVEIETEYNLNENNTSLAPAEHAIIIKEEGFPKENITLSYRVKKVSSGNTINYINTKTAHETIGISKTIPAGGFSKYYDKNVPNFNPISSSKVDLSEQLSEYPSYYFGYKAGSGIHFYNAASIVSKLSITGGTDEETALFFIASSTDETVKNLVFMYYGSTISNILEEEDTLNPYSSTTLFHDRLAPEINNNEIKYIGLPVFCDKDEHIDIDGTKYSHLYCLNFGSGSWFKDWTAEYPDVKLPYHCKLVQANGYLWAFNDYFESESPKYSHTEITKYTIAPSDDKSTWFNKIDTYVLPTELSRTAYTPVVCKDNIYIIGGYSRNSIYSTQNTIIKFDTSTCTAELLSTTVDYGVYYEVCSFENYIYIGAGSAKTNAYWQILDVDTNTVYESTEKIQLHESLYYTDIFMNDGVITKILDQTKYDDKFAFEKYKYILKDDNIKANSIAAINYTNSDFNLYPLEKKDGEISVYVNNNTEKDLKVDISQTLSDTSTNILTAVNSSTLQKDDIEEYAKTHQSDWEVTNETAVDFIKNKPEHLGLTTAVTTRTDWSNDKFEYVTTKGDSTGQGYVNSGYQDFDNSTGFVINYTNTQLFKSTDRINFSALTLRGSELLADLNNDWKISTIKNIYKYENNTTLPRWSLVLYKWIAGEYNSHYYESDDCENWVPSLENSLLTCYYEDTTNNRGIWAKLVPTETSSEYTVSYSTDNRTTWTPGTQIINVDTPERWDPASLAIESGYLYNNQHIWLINCVGYSSYKYWLSSDLVSWTNYSRINSGYSYYNNEPWKQYNGYFAYLYDDKYYFLNYIQSSSSVAELEVVPPSEGRLSEYTKLSKIKDKWMFHASDFNSDYFYVRDNLTTSSSDTKVYNPTFIDNDVTYIGYMNNKYIFMGSYYDRDQSGTLITINNIYNVEDLLPATVAKLYITDLDKYSYVLTTDTTATIEIIDSTTTPSPHWTGLLDTSNTKPPIKQIQIPTSNSFEIIYQNRNGSKMDKANPTGSGSLSLNRKADTVVGNYSVAIGYNCEASDETSYAEGYLNKSTGWGSHAEGSNTRALANTSHAEGYQTLASASSSHAEGQDTVASGLQSHAEGYGTVAKGYYSHTEGHTTQALGESSHAEGLDITAIGKAAHAEGFGIRSTTALPVSAISILGDNAILSLTSTTGLKIGNILRHLENETYNYYTIYSVSNNSIGLRTKPQTAYQDTSNWYLITGIANANFAHIEGSETTASDEAAHAEGISTSACRKGSHAEGYETVAEGNYSHAEGNGTKTTGRSSHAESYKTTASGDYSHAEGENTIASGEASHAEGYNTKASGNYQHVFGKFNAIEASKVEIVGNGSSGSPSNARTLDWDGNEWLAGGITTNGTTNLNGAITLTDTLKQLLLDYAYPINSIYMTTSSDLNTAEKMATHFGGTWEAWGTGRVPVGIDTTQAEFVTIEKTGGEKTHKLTISEIPSHSHTADYPKWADGRGGISTVGVEGGWEQNHSTSNTGRDGSHNNLQPYITCYMWKRIS